MRIVLSVFLVFCLLLSVLPTAAEPFDVDLLLPGDVDRNGVTDADDLTALARYVAQMDQLTDISYTNGDLDRDGILTGNDLTLLARIVSKLDEKGKNAEIAAALNGKKWVACGDSFSVGTFSGYEGEKFFDGRSADDPDADLFRKTYPRFIARRDGADVTVLAQNGATITETDASPTANSRHSFSRAVDKESNVTYRDIPAGADIITLMFGINDANLSVPIGELTDTDNMTFYGAWNTVLTKIAAAHPQAKIGIVISPCIKKKYRDAMTAVAERHGVGLYDFYADYAPLLYSTALKDGYKPYSSSEEKAACAAVYRIGGGQTDNIHPTPAWHEAVGWYLEKFLYDLITG